MKHLQSEDRIEFLSQTNMEIARREDLQPNRPHNVFRADGCHLWGTSGCREAPMWHRIITCWWLS